MTIKLKDTYNKELPADPIKENSRRQVEKACFSFVKPRKPSAPVLQHVSEALATSLGLSKSDLESQLFIDIVSGSEIYPKTSPYAMCYGGHQFGNWAGQLGDGRAINLFEMEGTNHQNWTLQLKGAGATPYSRSADGLAVLRSSIREHLCSEAMYHLGVPTTRSLSLVTTGDQVLRDILYNGNPAYEPGAVVCRVAPSFIRFGNFEIFAARGDHESLQKLVDYCLKYLFPEIKSHGKAAVLEMFQKVVNATKELMVHWQRVGFVHGVMNTDNMSILGLTIDYGPYGWLEDYNPGWTPNTTDAGQKRYRFGNQPRIALWNLVRLANALYPLVNEAKPFEEILDSYQSGFQKDYLSVMSAKLGLNETAESLVDKWDEVMQLAEVDMTIFFRLLSQKDLLELSQEELYDQLSYAFYQKHEFENEDVKIKWFQWIAAYQKELSKTGSDFQKRKRMMEELNPKYVLRNYMAQLAIEKAEKGDFSLVHELYDLLKKPYSEQKDQEMWFAKRPNWAKEKVGCSMLSCSS